MIRLTQRRTGTHFLVSPDAIQATGLYHEPTGPDGKLVTLFYVTYAGAGGDFVEIHESPEDVARLKAAWEMRFHAPELNGTLPISVGMGNKPDGPFILFTCCAITARLKEKIESEKSFWAKLRTRLMR